MVVDADAVVLGGSTLLAGGLALMAAYQACRAPAPARWRPKAVREAMRFARLRRLSQFRARAFVPRPIARRRRSVDDYDCRPLPMVLMGYFDES